MNIRSDISAVRAGVAVALMFALCGCGDEGSVANIAPIGLAPPPPMPPPISAPPPITPPCSVNPLPAECSNIEFQVYTAAGAIPDVDADIMLQPDTGWGDAYWYWPRLGTRLHSDSSGYFALKAVPPATIMVRAWVQARDYSQPCAAIFKSPNATVTQIQLFSEAEFDSVDAPRPTNATEPALIGTIYETTPQGRKPVSGAYMMASYPSTDPYWEVNEIGVATTRSSREGHYYLCRLPSEFQIYVLKDGFENAIVHPGVVATGVPFDIELRRKGT
jgi:hypothetical protein